MVMFADLRDNTTDKPRTTNAPAATAALAHTEESSYLHAMRAANSTMPTTIGRTRRVLLTVCDEGDDVFIRVQRPSFEIGHMDAANTGGGF